MIVDMKAGLASPYTSLEKGVYLLNIFALFIASDLALSNDDALTSILVSGIVILLLDYLCIG